jgi:hypothetical protein
LVKRRRDAVDAHLRVRGKWIGESNPNAFLTAEQKRVLAKRLTESRWRKQAGKRGLELQEHMAELRAMADALWGDWRPVGLTPEPDLKLRDRSTGWLRAERLERLFERSEVINGATDRRSYPVQGKIWRNLEN